MVIVGLNHKDQDKEGFCLELGYKRGRYKQKLTLTCTGSPPKEL